MEKFLNKIIQGDSLAVLKTLPDDCVDLCITSPPYFNLRDYQIEGQIGQEKTIDEYIQKLVDIFLQVGRILKDTGNIWLNLGDSYSQGGNGGGGKQDTNRGSFLLKGKAKKVPGFKSKEILGIPWRVAFALQLEGFYLRQDIIWDKPNCMPESVTDRFVKSHEYIFLLTKSPDYYFKQQLEESRWASKDKRFIIGPSRGGKAMSGNYAINKGGAYKKDGMRGVRSVWTINTKPLNDAHFAVFPEILVSRCIDAGCPPGGLILDPFMGAGTTALVARKLNRNFIGIEISEKYIEIAKRRLAQQILI